MKDFFKSFFASVLALVLVAGIGFGLVFAMIAAAGAASPTVPAKAVLVFDLGTNIPDSPAESTPGEALSRALSGKEDGGVPLASLTAALDRAAKDPKIAALYLTGNISPVGYGSGPAVLKEVREAIQRFKKDSGKPVLAYNLEWDKKSYYLAAGAGKVYVHPMGDVDVTGLASEPMFFGGAFKKYGVEVQVTRVGKYKSAVEPYILEKMSPENREQIQKLLDDIWGEWKETIAKDRHRSVEDIQKLADELGPVLGTEAVKAGLADQTMTPDAVLDELKGLAGKKPEDKDFPQIDLETYATKVPGPATGKGKQRIAVVYAEGEIVDGDGKGGQVGGDKLSRELRKLRLDKDVKAIVLRVNSPGGSATASELIQREVILARKAKPVVISMGHLAASGGYWISAYGDRIFAEPTTITGSIGVFGLLPNVQKLASDYGITFDEVKTAKMANAGTLTRPKTAEELARIQSIVDGIYDQFIGKVSEARKLPREKVQEIAQGRVWSGAEGLKLGLVDELGGLADAVRFAAKKAGIEGNYRMDAPAAPKPPLQRLLEAMGGDAHRQADSRAGSASTPALRMKRQAERAFESLSALNDPLHVYARMPYEFELR
ncbi:MAG: signal peptide peptidase SppA [Holophagaceae bacterium]|nr:signal peptide peptidase SppA [Holophagaceae bacterium]